jgi:hypothetical protein
MRGKRGKLMESICILPHKDPANARQGLVCDSHQRWIKSTLVDILESLSLLPHFYEPGTAIDDGRQVHGTRIDPAAPVRLDVVALLDRRTQQWHPSDPVPVMAVIESWARLVREERDLEIPTGPAILSEEVQLLTRHQDWIITQAWVDDYASEIRAIQTALRNAIGDHAPRAVGKCPIVTEHGTCAGNLYQDRYGRLAVACRRCGEVWNEEELARFGLILAS